MTLVCVLLLAAIPPSSYVSASIGNTTAFTFLGVDRTVVNAGQTITFTIRTVGANAVFANTGGNFVHASRQTVAGAPAGQTSWQLTITPMSSHTVVIYANTAATLQGAASVTIPVTVTGGTSGILQGGSQVVTNLGSPHRIYSITEVSSSTSGTITLRIVTDVASQHVWIRIGENQNLRATRVSNTATQRTWEVSYRPTRFVPHQIQVSANHAFVNDRSVVSQLFSVDLMATHSLSPLINRVSVSPSTVNRGERATITVRTNLDVAFVWAEVNGRDVNARRGSASATTRTWTIDVRPDRTQTVRVYANTENSVRGADVDTVRITVVDANPRIDSVVIRESLITWNQSTVIDVRTNADVEYVWAVVDGRRIYARREFSTLSTRTWTIDVRPERTQSIRVYGNAFDDSDGADIFSVHVTVQ